MKARLLALLTLSACGGGDSFSYTGTPGTVVALTFPGELPAAQVTINGGSAETFICDSGSPITILDTPYFPTVTDGKHNDDIGLYGLVVQKFPDAAWDFSASGAKGLIGGDLMSHFAFSIDYKGARGFLSDPFDPSQIPADVATGAATLVPFSLDGGGLASLPGTCNGGSCGTVDLPPTRVHFKAVFETHAPVDVILDTGATAIVLDEGLYNELGGTNRPVLDGIQVAGVGGVQPAFFTRVYTATIGGLNAGDPSVSLDDVPAFVVPGSTLLQGVSQEVGVDIKALIGGYFLRNYFVTVDYQHGELRLAKYTDESHIDPDEFIGPGWTLEQVDGDWQVSDIYSISDAYTQGVRTGDIIDDIGGMPIATLTGAEVTTLEKSYAVNTTMPISVRRTPSNLMISVKIEDFLPHYLPPP